MSKSAALNISLSNDTFKRLRHTFSFTWEPNSIKYLGVNITPDPAELFKSNFIPLLRKIQKELTCWHDLTLSWFGRCNAIKMTILPRLLYLFQAVPIAIPKTYFIQVHQAFGKFVWANKPPRLRRQLLHIPKLKGGIGLPNMQWYYHATLLTRLVDLCTNSKNKQWISVEKTKSRAPLEGIPWLSSPIPDNLKLHPTIGPTISLSRKHIQNIYKSTGVSNMNPIWGHQNFLAGTDSNQFRNLFSPQRFRLLHFRKGNRWLNNTELKCLTEPPLDDWSVLQLGSFLRSLPNLATPPDGPPLLENLCSKNTPTRHTLSLLYNQLADPGDKYSPTYFSGWERELGRSLTERQRETIIYRAHKTSKANRFQETNYKIMAQWYRVPTLLHRINPNIPSICWRCGGPDANMLHIFWSCPKLSQYWSQVQDTIKILTQIDLKSDPTACILHLTEEPLSRSEASLLGHLLTAAKACIPKLWRQLLSPTIKQWFHTVNDILQMEDMTATIRNTEAKFLSTWTPWIQFRTSTKYLDVITK